MKKKIVGICIMGLFLATAVLPVVGTMNETKDNGILFVNGPNIEWEFIVGGPNRDLLTSVLETEDGGFIAAGTTEEPNNVYSGWIIKLDKDGTEEWRTIETEVQGKSIYSFGITTVVQTHDAGYIISGACERYEDFKDGFLWKLTADGETEWFNNFPPDYSMDEVFMRYPWDILPVVNGYMVVGSGAYLGDLEGLDADAFVMKTDLNGDEEWMQIYRYGEHHDEFKALCPTLDGGYFIVGTVNTKIYGYPSPEDSDIWYVKTDAEGNKEWDKIYGGPEDEWTVTSDVFQTSDGGYIANSMTASYEVTNPSGDWNIWLQKLDGNGNELWSRTYGTPDQSDTSWGMDTTSDGGFVLAAAKNHNGMMAPQDEMWLIKTDTTGGVEWSVTFGGEKTERAYDVEQTSDDGFILVGTTASYGAGSWDGCIVKYSAFDNNRPDKPAKPTGPAKGDPDTEYTFSTSSSDPDGDSLQYMWDWGNGEYSDWLDTNDATYIWTMEDNFEIRVKAMDEHGGESDWSDPLSFSTPKNKAINTTFLRFLENHPHLFPLLRQLLNLQ